MLNCCVIGLGHMGSAHARVLKTLPQVKLVATADLVAKNAAYQDYRQLLKQELIDAVIIATPVATHFKIIKDCLLAGKHVLVEKPLTTKISDAKKLINLAKKKHLILAVGFIERFNPGVIKLNQLIRENQLGKIRSLIFQRIGPHDPRIKDVSVVEDISIHDLDLASWLLKIAPQKIIAFGGQTVLPHQIDHADIFLNYQKTAVHLQTSWISPQKIRRIIVSATKAYLEIDLIKEAQKQEPLKLELTAFVQSIKANKLLLATAVDGLKVLQLALKITKLIKNESKNRR